MQRFFMSALVAMLGLVVIGSAQANGPKSGPSGSTGGTRSSSYHPSSNAHGTFRTTSFVKNYHLTYGTKASFGYFYRGRNHDHWSYRCWNDRCGCYCYYCPCACCLYYWCAPDNCYYPVSYSPYGTFAY